MSDCWWVGLGTRISNCRALGVLELVLAHWYVGPVPNTVGCRVLGVLKLVRFPGTWGWFLGKLAEGPKMSQSWCWPAGEGAGSCHGRLQGCGGLGAWVCPLVYMAGAQDVLGLVSAHWCVRLVERLEPACWWAGPEPRGSWGWYLPTGGWSWVVWSLDAGPWGSQG